MRFEQEQESEMNAKPSWVDIVILACIVVVPALIFVEVSLAAAWMK
jgi:hypothetical protein